MQTLFKEYHGNFEETLSDEILDNLNLLGKSEAMLNVHFPQSQILLTKAQQRLKFEELFFPE